MIFSKRKKITITVKLFTGLHREAGIKDYDAEKGITLQLKRSRFLWGVIKSLGMKNTLKYAYFVNGERAGLFKKLNDGDELSCFKPSAGG